MTVEIKSREIKIVPLKDIKLNPKNRNKHPPEQLERLAKIIKYQGFRVPGVVSNRTGFLVAGEGRYLAAKLAGFDSMPVIYQDFDDEEQEYAFGVSDNAVASWAELDLAGINSEIGELGPDFDLENLGIKDFGLDPGENSVDPIDTSELQQFIVAVQCENESQMQQIYTEMTKKGLECKLIT